MRAVVALLTLTLMGGCNQAGQLCDEAIKSTLKAPATYKRGRDERGG
jgi:hypothetical protein